MKFCNLCQCLPFPATTSIICRYVAYLAERLSPASIPKYLSVIRVIHLETGLPNPLVNNWSLQTMFRGVKRDCASLPQRKLAVTPNIT